MIFSSEGRRTIPNESVCVAWDFLKRVCEQMVWIFYQRIWGSHPRYTQCLRIWPRTFLKDFM